MSAAIIAAVLAFSQSAQEPAAFDRGRWRTALEAAVDLPDAAQRRAAAAKLAADKALPLAELVPLLREFGRFAACEPGARSERVALQVGKALEQTGLVVYVPRGHDPARRAPLLVAFHGTGGSGAQCLPSWRTLADELGMFVLAPDEAGPNEGYAFSQRERDAALAALRWMRRRHDVDEERVFLTGVSRGGHLAWDLALRAPDLPAAIAPLIGSPRFHLQQGQNNLRFLENVVRLPIRDLQGAQDDPGMLANLRLAFRKLADWKAPDARLIEFEDLGHSYRFEAVDWKAFLGAARRATVPERLVRAACEKSEARAFFAEITGFAKSVVEDLQPKVDGAFWNRLGEAERREWLQREIETHTARLEVARDGPGRFTATSTGVTSFRLLLTSEMYDPAKPVVVLWNGKKTEKRVRADARVLLTEFVERFDRSFLPVAAIDVP